MASEGAAETSAPVVAAAAEAAAAEAIAVCECGLPALVLKPKRRAVARAFRSLERSLRSSNSLRAENSACSSIVHSRCSSGGRAKEAISQQTGISPLNDDRPTAISISSA